MISTSLTLAKMAYTLGLNFHLIFFFTFFFFFTLQEVFLSLDMDMIHFVMSFPHLSRFVVHDEESCVWGFWESKENNPRLYPTPIFLIVSSLCGLFSFSSLKAYLLTPTYPPPKNLVSSSLEGRLPSAIISAPSDHRGRGHEKHLKPMPSRPQSQVLWQLAAS